MVNIGGRYYLSTTSGTLVTNHGTLMVSPLTIYNFPCNTTFSGMKSRLSTCPKTLEITLPILKETTIKYIPWNLKDTVSLKLHYDSLNIPKTTKIDHNITEQLNKLYDFYDYKLSNDINIANEQIDKIKEDNFTTRDRIIMYTIGGFTAFCTLWIFIQIIIWCCHPKDNHNCDHCKRPKRKR